MSLRVPLKAGLYSCWKNTQKHCKRHKNHKHESPVRYTGLADKERRTAVGNRFSEIQGLSRPAAIRELQIKNEN